MVDVLGSLQVPHFFLHFHDVTLAVSHLHGFEDVVHLPDGIPLLFVLLFEVVSYPGVNYTRVKRVARSLLLAVRLILGALSARISCANGCLIEFDTNSVVRRPRLDRLACVCSASILVAMDPFLIRE